MATSEPLPLLCGTSIFLVDAKGRLVIPRAFREQRLGEQFYLAPLAGARVLVFNARDFQEIAGLRQVELRDLKLGLCWPAQTGEWGRTQIPLTLRAHLGIVAGSEVAISGCGEGVILCEFKRWKARYSGALWKE